MLRALHNTPVWEDWEHWSLENLLFNDKSTDLNSPWTASCLDEMQSVRFLGCSFPFDMSFRCDSLYTSHSLLVQQHLECCYLEIESLLISWEKAENEWNQERVLLKKTIETNLLHYQTEVLKLNECIEALKRQLKTLESQNLRASQHPYLYVYQTVNKKMMSSSSKSSKKQIRVSSEQQHSNESQISTKQVEMVNCSDAPLRCQDVFQSATPSPSLLGPDDTEGSTSTTYRCTRLSTKSPSPKGKKRRKALTAKGICANCQPYLDQLYKNYKELNLSFFHERQRFEDIQQRQNELLRCLKDEGFSYCETVGKVYPSWKKSKSDTIVQLQQVVKFTEEKYQTESRLYKVLIRRCNAAVLVALRGLGNRKRRPNTLPKKKWASTPTVALVTSSAHSPVSMPRKMTANSDSFDLSRELQLSFSNGNEVSKRSDEQKKKTKPFNMNSLNVCKDVEFEHSRTHLPLLTDFDKSHFYKKSLSRSNSLSKSLPLVVSPKTSNLKSHPLNLLDQRLCLSKSLNSLSTTTNRTSLPYNPLPSFSKSLKYQSSILQPIKKNTTHLPLIRFNSRNSVNSLGKTQQRQPQQSTMEVSIKDSFSSYPKGFSDILSLGTKANRAMTLNKQKSSNLPHDCHGDLEKMSTSCQTSNNRFNDSLTEIKLSRVSSPSKYFNHSQRNLNLSSSSQSFNKEKPGTQRSGNYPPSRSALRYTSSISCVPNDLSSVCVPSKALEDSKSLRSSYRTESSSKHDVLPMMQTFQRQGVFPPHRRLGANRPEQTSSREYTLPTLDLKGVEDHRFLDYLKPSSLPPRTLENSTAQLFPAFFMSKKPMSQKKDVSIQPETSLKRNLLSSLSADQMKKKNLPRPLRGWMDYALESLNLPVGVQSSPQRLSSSLSEAVLNRSRRV